MGDEDPEQSSTAPRSLAESLFTELKLSVFQIKYITKYPSDGTLLMFVEGLLLLLSMIERA